MTKRKSNKPPPVTVEVGDYVLLGGTQASYPCHWYLGHVVWVGDGDVLVKRSTLNGERYRQLASVLEIRARGTIDELVAIQKAAAAEVRDLQRNINEAESALGSARDALWRRLGQMADEGMKIIPPDFAAIEAADAAERAIAERVDSESDNGPLER